MNKFLLLVAFLVTTNAQAEDLGVKNRTYPADRDARDQIKDLIREKQKSGEVDRFWRDYQGRVVDSIKNPAPLGIASNFASRTELHDLRFVIPQDYRDEKGTIVARKGTVIEPLKIQPLQSGLIFIDGRDQRQVDYAIAQGRKEPLKIVLTAGSPFDLRVKYKNSDWYGSKTIPFYFDQRKMIINQLAQLYGIHVNSVPAKVSQRGTKLQIEFGMKQ